MADVKCIEPDCPYFISDPCAQVTGLFRLRMNLVHLSHESTGEPLAAIRQKILDIHTALQEDLGLPPEVYEPRYTAYKERFERWRREEAEALAVAPGDPIVFTLECRLKHRHQYTMSCD